MIDRDFEAEQREANELFARMEADELAGQAARDQVASQAGAAMTRLLELAETRDSGQIRKVVCFLASCYNSTTYPFDISDLRCVDEKIRLDILAVLQSQAGLSEYPYNLPDVSDGERRLEQIIKSWKPQCWPEASKGRSPRGSS